MKSEEIRQRFLKFFEKREHKVVPSSSLIPDDPSVLLTTAGMQQFKKYYTGELDAKRDFQLPDGKPARGAVSIQKCFRTSDIDEVGDESHLTFFEMLGNFSFGGYFKEEAIEYGHDFITEEMGLAIDKVTVFDPAMVPADDWRKGVPLDSESERLWKRFGVAIERAGADSFWGPTGAEGPCGPTTEIYIETAAGKSVEIWNIVFNEFYCAKDKKLTPLKTPGVDTGMGLERLAMVLQKAPTIFETDLFEPVSAFLKREFSKERPPWSQRIVADHARGIVFLVADGVIPNNKGSGYVLRRLIGRTISHLFEFDYFDATPPGGDVKKLHYFDALSLVAGQIIDQYGDYEEYSYFLDKRGYILEVIKNESHRYLAIKDKADKVLVDLREKVMMGKADTVSAVDIFRAVSTYGIPLEWIKDFLGKVWALKLDIQGYEAALKKHQEISRAGAEKKFGGHGLVLNTGELKAGSEEELKKITRLHTATHLLQRSLREVLGQEVRQMGSDITSDRARFDFSFRRKPTPEEVKRIEDLVNEKIKENLPVRFVELPRAEAEKSGALFFFKEKYPERVKVYYVGDDLSSAWSKEFCGGPHVARTGEIGKFRVIKVEKTGADTQRIRAIVE